MPRAAHAWSTLFVGRFNDLKRGLPAGLEGSIQICVPSTSDHPAEFMYVRLAGPRSAAYQGLAPEPEVWVEVDEDGMAAALSGRAWTAAPLRVSGRFQLWQSLLEALQGQGQPTSWLGIRGTR